jgi:hypothetical protein
MPTIRCRPTSIPPFLVVPRLSPRLPTLRCVLASFLVVVPRSSLRLPTSRCLLASFSYGATQVHDAGLESDAFSVPFFLSLCCESQPYDVCLHSGTCIGHSLFHVSWHLQVHDACLSSILSSSCHALPRNTWGVSAGLLAGEGEDTWDVELISCVVAVVER